MFFRLNRLLNSITIVICLLERTAIFEVSREKANRDSVLANEWFISRDAFARTVNPPLGRTRIYEYTPPINALVTALPVASTKFDFHRPDEN